MRKEIMMPDTKVVVLPKFFKNLANSLDSAFSLTSCIDVVNTAKVSKDGIRYTLRDAPSGYDDSEICDLANFNQFIEDVRSKLSTIKYSR